MDLPLSRKYHNIRADSNLLSVVGRSVSLFAGAVDTGVEQHGLVLVDRSQFTVTHLKKLPFIADSSFRYRVAVSKNQYQSKKLVT